MNRWTFVAYIVLFRTMLYVSGTKLCCTSSSGFYYGCTATYNGKLLPKSGCPDELKPKFHLYTKAQRSTPHIFTAQSIPFQYIGRSRAIFIVHGFNDHYYSTWVMNLKTALLDKGEENIIVLDWGKAAKMDAKIALGYLKAAVNTYGVSLALKAVAKKLVDAGTPQTELWCIGHSLGAHLCGNAGHMLKFGRITGLDPAGPLWDKYKRGLNDKSASFVDVIHTDGSGWSAHFGLLTPLGHADFYPHGGYRQPRCKFPFTLKIQCSHMRAVYYFIESVKKNCFISRHKCQNLKEISDKCPSVKATIMGYGAVSSTKGLFYVPVQGKRPYCKG